MSNDEGHPVVSGLAALVGVGVVVGLLVSGGALAASSVLGLDGDDDGGPASSEQSMYLPKPSDTLSESGPQITLQPGETPTGTESSAPGRAVRHLPVLGRDRGRPDGGDLPDRRLPRR